YHGVVDPDGDNPGQVLYGVDEHGNYRPVKVDNNGNVLTQVTGSNVEDGILVKQESAVLEVHEFNGFTIPPDSSVEYYITFQESKAGAGIRIESGTIASDEIEVGYTYNQYNVQHESYISTRETLIDSNRKVANIDLSMPSVSFRVYNKNSEKE